jgi:hypothetical protein
MAARILAGGKAGSELSLSVRVLPAQSAVVEHDLVPIDVVPETESSAPKPPGSFPGRNPLQFLDGVFPGPIVWIAAKGHDCVGENRDEIPVLFHQPFHQPLEMWRSPDEKCRAGIFSHGSGANLFPWCGRLLEGRE